MVEKLIHKKYFYRYRSAVTGKMVSQKFAEANPDKTVRERVRRLPNDGRWRP